MLPIAPKPAPHFTSVLQGLRNNLLNIVLSHRHRYVTICQKTQAEQSFFSKLAVELIGDPTLNLYAQLIERINKVCRTLEVSPSNEFKRLFDLLSYLIETVTKETLRPCIEELLNECVHFIVDHTPDTQDLLQLAEVLTKLPPREQKPQLIGNLKQIAIARDLYQDKLTLLCELYPISSTNDIYGAYTQFLITLEQLRATTVKQKQATLIADLSIQLKRIKDNLNHWIYSYFADYLSDQLFESQIRCPEILDQVLHKLIPHRFPAVTAMSTQPAVIDVSILNNDNHYDALHELIRLWLQGFEKQSITLLLNENIAHPALINKIIFLLTIFPTKHIKVVYQNHKLSRKMMEQYYNVIQMLLDNSRALQLVVQTDVVGYARHEADAARQEDENSIPQSQRNPTP